VRTLQENDFIRAAERLDCDVAAIKAVCDVEAPGGGFDARGLPRILFEGHVFSRLTNGKYDAAWPSISYPKWTRIHYARGANADERNEGEHSRLGAACALDRDAGLMAASWGKFQILGENWRMTGHGSLQKFINAMYAGEGEHLNAFVGFVQAKGLAPALQTRAWARFARGYNGPAYAENQYDTKLAAAYRKHAA
jgi:hypothetical protein